MAATVGSNNIYPPIVNPFAPTFIIDGDKGCRIYFSISAYNSIDEYQDVHITVTRQSDNLSALDKAKYPSQIKVIKALLNTGTITNYSRINIDNTRTSNDKYYIALSNDDIQNGFQIGVIYKVQIRFSNNESGLYQTPQKLDNYLSSHLSSFSEWSQACLIQGINQPELEIKNGQGGTLSLVNNNIWNTDTFEIVGTLKTDDIDPLRQYTLTLYDTLNNVIETSGTLFPPYQSSKDQINYVFKRALEDGKQYKLEIKYMTCGLYEDTITYSILTLLNLIERLDAYLVAIEDTENGRIGINIKSNSIAPFAGKITIRRTSSKSDFELWEDVYTIELRADKLEYLWYDYTIESGVWYKYCIQKRDIVGNRGIITKLDTPVMIIFDSLFLNADNTQIKIEFDPQISSFQKVVNDTKIDTIGSKYPYIKRNGATSYRQFPISGLITFLMDTDEVFMKKTDIYSENVIELYNDYNNDEDNRIDIYNDITYERDYREKVMDFLYKHNVKLFRSATEGNILVKLMDITFTPNQTLGRRIYNFQCTAYEVDDFTLENCDKYSIQQIEDPGNTGEILSYELNYEGQWDSKIPAAAELVHLDPINGTYSILEEYYRKFERTNYILSIDHLDYLRIEIYDDPYLIYDNGNNPIPLDEISSPSKEIANASYLGYIAYINGKTIIIPADGIYELKHKEVNITSLQFAKDTNAEIRYHVILNQSEDVGKILALTSFTERIGQEWGGFIPGESLYNKLWNKYYMEHPKNYYQSLFSINGIRVEANPGTVIYVREEGENTANRHIIGKTASLDFYDPESVIADAYFTGVHFEQATDAEIKRNVLPEGKYYKTDIIVDSLDKIINPQDRYVYYLEATNNNSNNINNISEKNILTSPELATLITAKGLPIFFIKKDSEENKNNIAIVDKNDLIELQSFLELEGYDIYITDSITFTPEQQIKTATSLDKTKTFDFVISNEENKNKLAAYKIILEQYGESQITFALKRSIWKDITHNVSDYYIYYNNHWYIFNEDTQDAVCPVPAFIDYWCETMKGYYRTSQS